MSAKLKSTLADTSDREIVITRVLDAPRELVWKVWTEPQHVAQWWGPVGFSTTIEKMDVRPGGVWKHVMRGSDGTEYPNKSVFVEIVKPERIVFNHGGAKKGGPAVSFRSTWTFDKLGKNKTQLTLRMVFKSAEKRDEVVRVYGALEGGKQTLARLGEYLQKMPRGKMKAAYGAEKVSFTRVFNAPRELVWKVWTEPKHLAKWWGPHGFTNPVCKMAARVGGSLRIVMRAPDGAEHPMTGVFREVLPPKRLVFTMVALDADEKPLLEGQTIATFTRQGGKTRLVVKAQAVGLVPIARQMLGGMQAGWSQSLERLAMLVTKT